jgi:hypothetical protein
MISINHRSPLMGWEFELKKKLKRKKIEENLFYIPHFNPIFLKLKGFPKESIKKKPPLKSDDK